ncbi:YesL family protein [Paenibacillus gansuensis]|uniref:YesL family protein n=1 Tax=Paenibacillus gansuensis TaxID=306542 RepID=A0ABW5PD89_9BACL
MRGLMGGFYKISEWIMRLSVINLLWVICSVPFIFVVIGFLQGFAAAPDTSGLVVGYLLIGIVGSLTFFPATGAMFTVARKWVTGDEDVPLFKTFFRGYKENYKQSFLGGLVYTLISVVFYVNFVFYQGQNGSFQLVGYLFIALSAFLFASMFHFFSVMVHFHMKFLQVLKNALLITIGRPVTTVLLLVVNLFVLYISFFRFTFLIPFFMGSIIAYMSFFQFHRIFTKSQLKLEQEALAAEEAAEEERKASEAVETKENS